MNRIYQKIKEKIKYNNFLLTVLKIVRAHVVYFLNIISNNQIEKIRFFKKMGYPLNLKNPRSVREKTVWKKINDRNPLLPITSDKYQVRTYIKEILGEDKAKKILIPLLYVTDKPENIPFEKLPPAFIIKPNHASGLNIIVEDGHFNKKKIINTCKSWLKIPYGLEKLEWAYQLVKRKIVIEKLLLEEDGSTPKELGLHMFHGRCKSVRVICNRRSNPIISFFDEKWNFLPVKKPNRPQGPKIQKPKNYEAILELAEKLSKPFDYVRVDFYSLKEKIYIGELTHYSASGIGQFEPSTFSFELGKHWKIEPEYWKTNENKKLE